MTEVHLRIYDDRSDTTQPAGPVPVEVPDTATDAQIIEAIVHGWVNSSRPFTIYDRRGQQINPGWALVYRD